MRAHAGQRTKPLSLPLTSNEREAVNISQPDVQAIERGVCEVIRIMLNRDIVDFNHLERRTRFGVRAAAVANQSLSESQPYSPAHNSKSCVQGQVSEGLLAFG